MKGHFGRTKPPCDGCKAPSTLGEHWELWGKAGLCCFLCKLQRKGCAVSCAHACGEGRGLMRFPLLTSICHNFGPWLVGREGGGESTSSILAGSAGDAAEGCHRLPSPAGGAAQAAGRSGEPRLALLEPMALPPLPWGDEVLGDLSLSVLWSLWALLRDIKSSPWSQQLPVHLPEPALPEWHLCPRHS